MNRKAKPLWTARFARLAALVALVLTFGVSASAAPPPQNGSPAPNFTLPLAANGKGEVSLAALKGHAVYINFFASWCGPCKAEAPSIARLAHEFAKHNVIVVGIDELEANDRAKTFAAQYKLPYRIAVDSSGDVGGNYGLIGLPLHVFIAPNGTVAMHREGEMSESQIRTELQSLSSR